MPYPLTELDEVPTRAQNDNSPNKAGSALQSPRFGATITSPSGHTSGPPSDIGSPVPKKHTASPRRTPSASPNSSITNLNLGPGHTRLRSDFNVYGNLSTPAVQGSREASTFDLTQLVLQQHLGQTLAHHLMPRMKTIELYRKNAKKSDDPAVLFQYAQYMLQTALLLEDNSASTSGNATPPSRSAAPSESGSSLALNETKNSHRKLQSGSSLLPEGGPLPTDNVHVKKALLKEAQVYLKKLSDKGYVEAQYLLGDAYSSGAFGKVDHKEAFSLFLTAAKHGHVELAFRTALCYEEGLGTGRDARKDVEFLRSAASKNHPAAMYKLGVYSFYSRMGMPANITTKKLGIKWLERALNVATELTAAAPYELGKIYYNGFLDILIQDQQYALELYAQAAALGHVEALAILGRHYELGEIVHQDANLLIHYYTKAALGGHPESMLAMCAWYLVGADPFLPKDEQEAFEWALRAAKSGLPKAQYAVATFYDKGIGCLANTAEAQTWYKAAAENGEEKAIARLKDKQVAAQLTKNLAKRKARDPALSDAEKKDCVIM